MSQNGSPRTHGSDYPNDVMPEIIHGVETNDFAEVDAALEEDPSAINIQESTAGLTALHLAAGDGNLKMVEHLLSKKGINITIKDSFDRDALDLAIAIGNKPIIEAISKSLYPKSFGPLAPPTLG